MHRTDKCLITEGPTVGTLTDHENGGPMSPFPHHYMTTLRRSLNLAVVSAPFKVYGTDKDLQALL